MKARRLNLCPWLPEIVDSSPLGVLGVAPLSRRLVGCCAAQKNTRLAKRLLLLLFFGWEPELGFQIQKNYCEPGSVGQIASKVHPSGHSLSESHEHKSGRLHGLEKAISGCCSASLGGST